MSSAPCSVRRLPARATKSAIRLPRTFTRMYRQAGPCPIPTPCRGRPATFPGVVLALLATAISPRQWVSRSLWQPVNRKSSHFPCRIRIPAADCVCKILIRWMHANPTALALYISGSAAYLRPNRPKLRRRRRRPDRAGTVLVVLLGTVIAVLMVVFRRRLAPAVR